MSVRFIKQEQAQRCTASQTLNDPSASSTQKYHARLLLRQTERGASERAAKNEPAPRIHRGKLPPPDSRVKDFLDAVSAMLENEAGPASGEASQPETASVAPRTPELKPPTGDEICTLCLIPRGNCGHSGDQSKRGEVQND